MTRRSAYAFYALSFVVEAIESIRKPWEFADHLRSAVTWLDLAMATPADELLEEPEPSVNTYPVCEVRA